MKVLLTGATGFVASHLYPALVAAGHEVVCASRSPDSAGKRFPGRLWVFLDLADRASVERALEGCETAYYLVHGMAGGADYPEAEAKAAQTFAEAAELAGLQRIIYLGGMAPAGAPSRHLASRLRTGAVLREGKVPTVELRASMIIGAGGASWRICRDLAARLPVMILPRWLRSRTQPVAIADVVVALLAALEMPGERVGVYDIPGPDTLSIREILERIASLLGNRPLMVNVPFVSPHLSTYWMRLVARVEMDIARELVEGLHSDILARDEGIWMLLPDHPRIGFDEAARRALAAEQVTVSSIGRFLEDTVHRVARKA